jgi:glycosyltransferase involved in cell wall biosynthesis
MPTIHSVVFVAPFGLGQKSTVWARTLPLAQHLSRQSIQTAILIPPWDTPAHAGLCWNDAGVELDNVRLKGGPPTILARLAQRIRKRKPDIVHIVKPLAYAGAVQSLLWMLRRLSGLRCRIVLDADDWEQAWAVLNQRSLPVQQLIRWQENWGLTHADGITTASRWLAGQIQNCKPNMPLCYIPNGVYIPSSIPDQAAYSPIQASTKRPDTTIQNTTVPVVLFFTRFIEIPPEWLLDFCRELFAIHSSVILKVAGSGVNPLIEADFKQKFHAYSQANPLYNDRIQWLGHIAPDALDKLFSEVSCAIFPAQPTPLQLAKCSVRLATTLLHGVPVVASAVGEQASYGAAGAAVLVEPDATAAEFARQVISTLTEPARRHALQIHARTHLLNEYSWPTLGARMLDFYQSIG